MPRRKLEYPRPGEIKSSGERVTIIGEVNPGTPCYRIELSTGEQADWQKDKVRVLSK